MQLNSPELLYLIERHKKSLPGRSRKLRPFSFPEKQGAKLKSFYHMHLSRLLSIIWRKHEIVISILPITHKKEITRQAFVAQFFDRLN
ncbi:MAG TPA: hypothetical protein VFW25_12390 [Silvibacterium sp.]|nr:hypothetical protein [Silvibacterium sp.]